MKATGLDTNALLTFRLGRQPGLNTIQNLFEQCLAGRTRIYIPLPTLLETEWVLRSYYKQTKEQVVGFLTELLALDHLITDDRDEVEFALALYQETTQVNFTDCLILRLTKSKGYDLLTFDRNLQKLA